MYKEKEPTSRGSVAALSSGRGLLLLEDISLRIQPQVVPLLEEHGLGGLEQDAVRHLDDRLASLGLRRALLQLARVDDLADVHELRLLLQRPAEPLFVDGLLGEGGGRGGGRTGRVGVVVVRAHCRLLFAPHTAVALA